MDAKVLTSKIDQLMLRNLTEFESSSLNSGSGGHFIGKSVTGVEPVTSGTGCTGTEDDLSAKTLPDKPARASDANNPCTPETATTLLVSPSADGTNPHFLAVVVSADHSAHIHRVATIEPRLTAKAIIPETVELQLARCNYYYGDFSLEAAHEMLQSQDLGNYLLRNSKTVSNCPFALSMKGTKHPFSVRIKLENGRYELMTDQYLATEQRPSYPNVTKLLDHAVDKNNVHRLFLMQPGEMRLKCSPVVKSSEFIHRECLERLEQCRYFYKDMDHHQARCLLNKCEPGTFLLRKSSETPEKSPFTLSIQTSVCPISFKIRFSDGLYYTDCQRFINRWSESANCVLTLIEILKMKKFITLLEVDDGSIVQVFLATPLERNC